MFLGVTSQHPGIPSALVDQTKVCTQIKYHKITSTGKIWGPLPRPLLWLIEDNCATDFSFNFGFWLFSFSKALCLPACGSAVFRVGPPVSKCLFKTWFKHLEQKFSVLFETKVGWRPLKSPKSRDNSVEPH